MICLDTSVLVEGLGAGGSLREAMQETIAGGKRLVVPSLVLYEWLCGPRLEAELRAQEALFRAATLLPAAAGVLGHGAEEAARLGRRAVEKKHGMVREREKGELTHGRQLPSSRHTFSSSGTRRCHRGGSGNRARARSTSPAAEMRSSTRR